MPSTDINDLVDVLAERRVSSDFAWVSRPWTCPTCRYSQNRSPKKIQQHVLRSQRVRNVIKQMSQEKGKTDEEVEQMADSILDEMSHNFQLRAIRFFGYILSKAMKRLYQNVFVNKGGIEKVSNISSQYPILYLPTHRSYADFLLVSYICFHFNLPIPVIAAGIDFLGLKTVSSLLRNSGAFFIRRSFIDDQLYWEVFSEYVKSHIQGGEFPVEFFIEGTRSRTGKSLVPKLGMLQVIMDEVFTSKIPDVTVVPISISYDRTLEESLYAFELLGVPKPKESTKGLIKARKILSDNFGNVYVRFGDPISSKDFFKNYDRSKHNLHPRNSCVTSKDEQLLCRDLANYVISMHHSNLLLSVFPLMCMVIGHPFYLKLGGVHLRELVNQVFFLKEYVERAGAFIVTDNLDPTKAVEYQLNLHANIVKVSENSIVTIQCSENEQPIHRLQKSTLSSAVPSMFIYHYGNQAMQLLIHISMVCLAVSKAQGDMNKKESVFWRYCTLRKLFQREFVFERLTAEEDFDMALMSLMQGDVLYLDGPNILPVLENEDAIHFLSQLPIHFLISYQLICKYLINCTVAEDMSSQSLSHQCQLVIENSIINGDIQDYRCLSLDVINNCISLLVSEGALIKEKRNNRIALIPRVNEIFNILNDIEYFLPTSDVVVNTSWMPGSSKL